MRDVASRRRRSSTVCHSYGAGFILHHAWGDGLLEIEMPNQDIYNNNKCVCVSQQQDSLNDIIWPDVYVTVLAVFS